MAIRESSRNPGVTTPKYFPPPASATPDGLISVGGELSVDWLLDAYRHGIFPWPTNDRLLAWWSPDPRATIEFREFHVSRSLRRTLASGRFRITRDQAFARVLVGCATAQNRRRGTWLNADMRAAYTRLHELGFAHSVEAWREGHLVGGTYGVAIGAAFAAESMFYLERDASKVALAALVAHLESRDFELLDIQQLTPHTLRLGAGEIPRSRFLARLARAIERSVSF